MKNGRFTQLHFIFLLFYSICIDAYREKSKNLIIYNMKKRGKFEEKKGNQK